MTSAALGLSDKRQAMRLTGIGASEVAKVIGIVPGAIEVWEGKVGAAPEREASSLSEFGQRIERVIAEAWAARHPKVRVYTPGTLRHPRHAWALASPDRVVAPPGFGRPAREDWLSLLEIKTAFFSDREYTEDEVPERHLVQVAWQLAVCGLEEAELVALVRGEYRAYAIRRDRELEGMLLEAVGKWWTDHVLAGIPPPVDGSDAYADYLRRRYPKDGGALLDPTPEAGAVVKRLRAARANLRQAEEAEALAKQELQTLLGEAAGVRGLVTWKANKDGTKTDWEAVARAAGATPELIAANTTTKPGARVLRLLGKE